jgi:hypothetical protein
MSKEIIKYLHECNLVACYLLPLLEINKFKFGDNNFVEAYVNRKGTQIYVEVNDFSGAEDPYHNDNYSATLGMYNRKFIVFTLPEKWKHTFQMFREGKYSEFTKLAKAMILQHSGLLWKQPATGKSRKQLSDGRLLAMYRSDVLRIALADQLEIDPDDLLDRELIDPPRDSEFIESVGL